MLRRLLIAIAILAALLSSFWYFFLSPRSGVVALPRLPRAERYQGLAAPFGQPVPETESLRDIFGNARSLAEFRDKKTLVLCFLGAECPLSNRLIPRLKQLEARERPLGVQFLAIYPNESETIDAAAAHAGDFDVPFPVWKDYGQKLANSLGIERVPQFCVVDLDGALVYRGRFDDEVSVSGRRNPPQREDLALAIEDARTGQRVRVSQTEADGCLLDRTAVTHEGPVNFVEHVAPILQERCEACHRQGSMGPFALSTYDDAKQWAAMIKEVTTQRRMPPWHADPRYSQWANNRRLSEEDIKILAAWVDQGAPSGDLAQFKPREWSSAWEIGEPDAVVEAEKGFEVPADGVVPYQFIFARQEDTDALFKEDMWLVSTDVKPGAPQVVHHLMVYAVEPGNPGPQVNYNGCRTIGAYVPGNVSLVFPPGTAALIPKGSRVCFEMHYTPNGKAVVDRPKVGLKFAKQPPDRQIRIAMLEGKKIKIPPQEPNYKLEGQAASPTDAEMLALFPHQHMRGKSFKFVAHFPDGRHETLLSVPRMDYFWQSFYWFKDPPVIPQGTVIHCIAKWDNSAAVFGNPDPNATVLWGPQSTDEMFVAWLLFIEKRR